jgi:hypothetical protein
VVVTDELRNALNQDSGFARPRSSDDEHRAGNVVDCLLLLRVRDDA